MTIQNILPSEGYLRLIQIIGQPEVTPEQAEFHLTQPVKTRSGKPKFQHKRPRTGITPVISGMNQGQEH